MRHMGGFASLLIRMLYSRGKESLSGTQAVYDNMWMSFLVESFDNGEIFDYPTTEGG